MEHEQTNRKRTLVAHIQAAVRELTECLEVYLSALRAHPKGS